MHTVLKIIFFIILLICLVFLQIKLSQKANKKWGLLLPILSFAFGLLAMGYTIYWGMQILPEDVVQNNTQESATGFERGKDTLRSKGNNEFFLPSFGAVASMFLTYHIPTFVLLGTHIVVRRKNKGEG